MRLLRALPLIPTALLVMTAALVALLGGVGVHAPTAGAQEGSVVIVLPPVELGPSETATVVLQAVPAGSTVGAVSLIIDFPPVVSVTEAEPLVSGACPVSSNSQIRFSGFDLAGWTTPTDLCRITLQGAPSTGSGTPTITINVAANEVAAPLTTSVDVGAIRVGAAPAEPVVITPTPVPEPTTEPTAEPVEEPTPDPEPEPSPTPAPAAADDDTSGDDDQADDEQGTAVDDADAADVTASADDGALESAPLDDEPAADSDRGSRATDAAPEDEASEAADASKDDADGPDADDPDASEPEAVPSDDATSSNGEESTTGTGDGSSDVAAADQSDDQAAADAPLPPLPADSSNQGMLVGLIAGALIGVGALLGFGARRANQSATSD